MSPKATLLDFHGCGSFHRLSPSEPFFLFASFSFFVKIHCPLPGKCRARIAYGR
jgi:hypothetical protein